MWTVFILLGVVGFYFSCLCYMDSKNDQHTRRNVMFLSTLFIAVFSDGLEGISNKWVVWAILCVNIGYYCKDEWSSLKKSFLNCRKHLSLLKNKIKSLKS